MDDTKEKHTVAALQTPAYTGALFNSLGFCINHHNVRLCTVTREGKYQILRKICPKCGSTSLRSNVTRHRVTQLHGSAKKELPLRKMPKDMLTAIVPPEKGGKGGSSSTTKAKLPDEAEEKPSGTDVTYNMKKSVPPSIKVRKSKGSTTAESTSSPLPQLRARERSKSERKDLVPLLVELYPPPPPQRRSRSKSRSRKSTTKTKPMRSRSRTPIPISVSSCKSVRDKAKALKSLVANYTTELDELTLLTATTATSQSTYSNSFKGQRSFKSKQAVSSIDKSDLLVKLYEKENEDLVGQEKKSRNSGGGGNVEKLRRSSKLKQKSLTTKPEKGI